MGEKVVSLKGDPIYAGEPNPKVIAELERRLDAARSGDLDGVVITVSHFDDTVSTAWAGKISRGVVGALFSLMQRITTTLDEG